MDKPRNRAVPRDLSNRMVIGGRRLEALSGRRIADSRSCYGARFLRHPSWEQRRR